MSYVPQAGCVEDVHDSRDLSYEPVLGAAALAKPDWDAGSDAFAKVGLGHVIQDQGRSRSCVGQGVKSYFRRVLQKQAGIGNELSAGYVYAQIRLPNTGGATLRDGMKVAADQGMLKHEQLPDYEAGNPPTEQYFINLKITEALRGEAKKFDRFTYRAIDGFTTDMDAYAFAIENHLGILAGFTMSNEGWMRPVVRPPAAGERTDGHAVDCAAYGRLDIDIDGVKKGTRCLFTLNSWGGRYTIKEGRWKGYQAIPETYFTPGQFVFRAWVFVPDADLSIEQQTMDFLKINEGKLVMDSAKGRSGAIGWVKGGKILVAKPERVPAMVANYLVEKEGKGVAPEVWDAIKSQNLISNF